MNRMHPEDLRAIIAAIQCLDPHYHEQVPSAAAVRWADDLLAELAKTAKQEAEPVTNFIPAMCQFIEDGGGSFRKWLEYSGQDYETAYTQGWMGFTNALHDVVERAEKAGARVKELEDELANKAFDASIILGDNQRQRIAELEAEVQRQKQCRERSIRLMGAKIQRQRTQLNYFQACGIELIQARAEKAEAALQTARAEGAREERERLAKWIRHDDVCWAAEDCTCGLREALEANP